MSQNGYILNLFLSICFVQKHKTQVNSTVSREDILSNCLMQNIIFMLYDQHQTPI